LDALPTRASGDARFVSMLLQICFGTDILASSSITGKSTYKSNSTKVTQLDQDVLEFIKRELSMEIMDEKQLNHDLCFPGKYLQRLGNAVDKPQRAKLFNDYVSRKIQNTRKEILRKANMFK
jgi:BEN domain